MNDDDRHLLDRFLEAVKGVSPERIAAGLPGISAPTIRRYQRGEIPSRLETDTRLAMLAFVNGYDQDDEGDTGREEPAESFTDWLTEMLVRDARAAEKRAEAAVNWTRWLNAEADASRRMREYAMLHEQKPTGAKPSPYRPAPGARGTTEERKEAKGGA